MYIIIIIIVTGNLWSKEVSNLGFYTQPTITVISGRRNLWSAFRDPKRITT